MTYFSSDKDHFNVNQDAPVFQFIPPLEEKYIEETQATRYTEVFPSLPNELNLPIFSFLNDQDLLQITSPINKQANKTSKEILCTRDGYTSNPNTERWLHVFLKQLRNNAYPKACIPKFNIDKITHRHNLSPQAKTELIVYFLNTNHIIYEHALDFLMFAYTVPALLPILKTELIYQSIQFEATLQHITPLIQDPDWRTRINGINQLNQLCINLNPKKLIKKFNILINILIKLCADRHPHVQMTASNALLHNIQYLDIKKSDDIIQSAIQPVLNIYEILVKHCEENDPNIQINVMKDIANILPYLDFKQFKPEIKKITTVLIALHKVKNSDVRSSATNTFRILHDYLKNERENAKNSWGNLETLVQHITPNHKNDFFMMLENLLQNILFENIPDTIANLKKRLHKKQTL